MNNQKNFPDPKEQDDNDCAIYIDKLSFPSLINLLLSRKTRSGIYYFESGSSIKKIINLFLRLKILNAEPQQVQFCLEDIRGENDESKFYEITHDITKICAKIKDQQLESNVLIRKFAKNFDIRKIFLFLQKIIARDIEMPIIYINAAKWHSMQNRTSSKNIYFLSNNVWFDYLSKYCEEKNFTVKKHGIFKKSYYFKNYYRNLYKRWKVNSGEKVPYLIKSIVVSAMNKLTIKPKSKIVKETEENNKPKVAAWYSGKEVTYNLENRSEFFWLINSCIPYNQVLIYFQRTDLPVTDEIYSMLEKKGLSAIAFSKNSTTAKHAPVFNCSFDLKRFIKLSQFASSVLNLLSFKQFSKNLFCFQGIIYFTAKYLFWFNFFKKNNVKININPNDFVEANIPMQQAIEDSGGVSISYHWSNIHFASIGISNCTDVFFSFGPEYRKIYSKNGSVINNFIISGYITDYSFKQVGENARKIRNRLLNKGVKFVVCFFDENSWDDVNSIITNKKSADTYKYFINKMLEDETLGLIFKPTFPFSIYQRISSISDLIEEAKATGRCIFLDKGSYMSEQYPTEAAQASDLCVGLLLSGTVALESYLSGTPTVFLDIEKLYSDPIYQWGKGKVVFDSLDALFSAIQKYRDNPDSISGFGDLSRWAKNRDPFKDGNASMRIGQYINWLLEKLNEGKTREEAIEYANQMYKTNWGERSIIQNVGI